MHATENTKTLIVIAGPTAVGKTQMAVQLAQQLKTEIVSADSRQFFKQLNIGTAKPSQSDLNLVPHHFIDCIEPNEKISAGAFEKMAIQKIENLFKTNQYVILTGGSGLYIDAVCNGIDEFPEIEPTIKKQVEGILKNNGILGLQALIKQQDPAYFSEVDLNNKARLMRAAEVILQSGKTYTSFKNRTPKPRPFKIIKICLNLPRPILYERINQRTDEMMAQGWLKEAKNLYPLKSLQSLNTVGYKELFMHFEGKFTLNEAIEKIKQHTRNYAKRQITYFKRDTQYHFIDASSTKNCLQKILELIN